MVVVDGAVDDVVGAGANLVATASASASPPGGGAPPQAADTKVTATNADHAAILRPPGHFDARAATMGSILVVGEDLIFLE